MKITPAQMARWRKLEAEHTKNRFQQEKIVRDHVREHGSQYYPALIKMERGLKKR